MASITMTLLVTRFLSLFLDKNATKPIVAVKRKGFEYLLFRERGFHADLGGVSMNPCHCYRRVSSHYWPDTIDTRDRSIRRRITSVT